MTTGTWDAIIIGAGAAGLSAALTLGRSRRKTLVLDAGSPRNRFAARAHGILGLDGIPPKELLETGRRQAEHYGVEIRREPVSVVEEIIGEASNATRGGNTAAVRVHTTSGNTYEARALLVATGMTDALPDLPGLRERWGTTVLHCPYCHGWEVRDQRFGVLALSPMAFHQAQLVRQWSDQVTLFAEEVPEDVVEKLRSRGVEIVRSAVVGIEGPVSVNGENTADSENPEGNENAADGAISGIRTADGQLVPVDAIFTFGDAQPHDSFLTSLSLSRNDTPMGSFLAVDALGKTSARRIWAAGNVVNPAAFVSQSAADGMFAAAQINMALVEEDYERAVEGQAQQQTPRDHWEARYSEKEAMWSGNANRVLTDVSATLEPGTALDLGCGEGADVIWLAQQSWDALGLDISATAIGRATNAAKELGASAGEAVFRQADLSDESVLTRDSLGQPDGFDLVTASFLHSTVDLPRMEILRRASDLVAEGGHLLVTTHAAPPPWAAAHFANSANEHEHEHAHNHDQHRQHEPGHGHNHVFLSPQEEIDALDLPTASWKIVLAETRLRDATAPDGTPTQLEDGVLLLQRL